MSNKIRPKKRRPRNDPQSHMVSMISGVIVNWIDIAPLTNLGAGSDTFKFSQVKHRNKVKNLMAPDIFGTYKVEIFKRVMRWRIEINCICEKDGKEYVGERITMSAKCKLLELDDHFIDQIHECIAVVDATEYKHFSFTAEIIKA